MKKTDTDITRDTVNDNDRGMVQNYIVDSSAWLEYYFAGENADKFGKYIEPATPDHYFTPTVIIYEVFKKIYNDISEEEALKAIAIIKYSTKTIDLTDEIAISSAEHSVNEKLPMADAIVFKTAQMYDSILITGDRHFKGKENIIYFGK